MAECAIVCGMPNGRPGDHPYTDVFVHGKTIFGSLIDDLIRRIGETGGCTPELSRLLMEHEPRIGKVPDLAPLEAALRAVLAQRGEVE